MHEPFEAASSSSPRRSRRRRLTTRNDSKVHVTRARMCPRVSGWRRMVPKSRELAKFSPCTNHSRQQALHPPAVLVAITSPSAYPPTTAPQYPKGCFVRFPNTFFVLYTYKLTSNSKLPHIHPNILLPNPIHLLGSYSKTHLL